MALLAVRCSPAQEGSGMPQSYSGGQATCSCQSPEQSSGQTSEGRSGWSEVVSPSAHVDVGDNALNLAVSALWCECHLITWLRMFRPHKMAASWFIISALLWLNQNRGPQNVA